MRALLFFVVVAFAESAGEPPRVLLERAVTAFLRAHAGDGNRTVRVEFRSIPPLPATLPAEAAVRVVVAGGERYRGNVNLPVEIVTGDRVVYRGIVSVRVRLFGPALVTTRNIDRHAILTADDVRVSKVELTAHRVDALSEIDGVLGMRAKRILSEGSLLLPSHLEPVPLIVRGSTVAMRVRTGNVMLTGKATALDDGWMDDVITVRPTGRQDRLQARVVDAQTVELVVR